LFLNVVQEEGIAYWTKRQKYEGFHYLLLACEKALHAFRHFLNRFRKVF